MKAKKTILTDEKSVSKSQAEHTQRLNNSDDLPDPPPPPPPSPPSPPPTPAAITYSYGDDTENRIRGAINTDYIYGRGGKDILHGKGGNDRLYGGNGDDILFGGAGNDRLVGGAGNDVFHDNVGTNIIIGGRGNDTLYIADRGQNTFSGQEGDDLVSLENVTQFDLTANIGRLSGIDRINLNGATLEISADSVSAVSDHNSLFIRSGTLISKDSTSWIFEGVRRYDGSTYSVYAHLNSQGNRVEIALGEDVVRPFDNVLDLGRSSSVQRIDGVALPNAAGRPPLDQDKTDPDPRAADWVAQTGFSVAGAVDFNRDGYADIIIGAPSAGYYTSDGGYMDTTGAVYVLYGSKDGIHQVDLSKPLGQNGIRIFGDHAGANLGFSVASAGDVNGDGIGDIIVGSPLATGGIGAAYVIFGKEGGYAPNTDLHLEDLQPSDGFRIVGPNRTGQSGQYNGFTELGGGVASAGDFNGDGLADVFVGAAFIDPDGLRVDAGEGYVIFGTRSGHANDRVDIDAFRASGFDGRLGVRIIGVSAYDRTANQGIGIGDLNYDGFDDIAVSAPQADNNGPRSGSVYILFGSKDGFGNHGTIDLAHLSVGQGFRIDGPTSPLGTNTVSGRLGISLAGIGDVNNDGIADFLTGADRQDNNGQRETGGAYIIYGSKSLSQAITLDLNHFQASQGIHIIGEAERDRVGYTVSSAGDFNRDGIADLIIGSSFVDGKNGIANGASYLIYGKAGGIGDANGVLKLADLLPEQGFQILGANAGDQAGVVSRAGDINKDGYDDLIIGAYSASYSGSGAGSVYVLYGGASHEAHDLVPYTG